MTGALSWVRVGPRRSRAMAPTIALALLGLVFVSSGTASATGTRPVVAGIGPRYGPAAGGTTVEIVGDNLATATAVDFGTAPAESFIIIGTNAISAVSPPGTGIVDVIVATTSGTSKTSSNDKFDYGPTVACPSGLSTGCPIDPSYGSSAGGTIVTISGTNFTGATAVSFGPDTLTPADNDPPTTGNFLFFSDTEIIANAPPGVGIVNVSVVNSGGTSRTSDADEFDYGPSLLCPSPPTVGCPMTPTSGPPTGGTIVSISGTNFTGATSVNFGTSALTSADNDPPLSGNFFFVSDTQIVANTPPGVGVVNVVVTTPGGSSTLVSGDQFSYAPIVTSVDPGSGPATGGTSVVISGSGFTDATAVDFGSNAATFTDYTDSSIMAFAPAGKVPSVDVTVTTPGGTSLPNADAVFEYGPVVALVRPNSGVGTGGTKVTVIGLNFKAVTGVDFGETPADSFHVVSATRLVAYAPAGIGDGVVDVTIVSAAGASPLVPAATFDYAPSVSHVMPDHGPAAGGTTVTVSGTNFNGVTAVDFGTTPATKVTVVSSKKITVVSPPGSGTVDVTVTTVGGTSSVTSGDEFTY